MSSSFQTRAVRIGLALALFALVLGIRWAVVFKYGSDLPEWDQWDAEGMVLLAPWLLHKSTLAMFFHPHNEHRIVLTKLLNFGLTLANGQWDQRLDEVVNPFLPALIAVGWFGFGVSFLRRRWLAPLWLFLAMAYAFPLSWQNVLAGFHSQQFFLIGLSFGAVAWLGDADPWSGRWWCGAVCAVLALGTMATGFFAAVIVGAMLLWRSVRREISWPAAVPTLVLCAAVAATGWFTRVVVPGDRPFMAHDAHDFILYIVHSLQWPIAASGWAAVPLWLPWAWVTVLVMRGAAGPRSRAGWLLAGMGGWVLLQLIATAYGRGNGAAPPASRYLDTIVVGAVANGLAAAWLIEGTSGVGRSAAAAAAAAWMRVFGTGAARALRKNFEVQLPANRAVFAEREESVRSYIATGDRAFLRPGKIPYPSVDVLVERLAIPGLRALLPASVRAPLAVATATDSGAFTRHDYRAHRREADAGAGSAGGRTGVSPATPPLTQRVVWGSFGAKGAAATGTWTSRPLRAAAGWLALETAGQIGEPGVSLELCDPVSGRVLSSVRPSRVPGNSWRTAYVPAPPGPFILAAKDSDPTRWLAFAEPVEMAPLSHLALQTARQGRLLAEIAAAAAAILLAVSGWCERGETADSA